MVPIKDILVLHECAYLGKTTNTGIGTFICLEKSPRPVIIGDNGKPGPKLWRGEMDVVESQQAWAVVVMLNLRQPAHFAATAPAAK